MAILHPTITFQVNLQTVNALSHLPPDRYREDQDAVLDDINQHSGNRSTIFINGRILRHGEKFTLSGEEATKMRDRLTTGDNPSLVVCSADPDVNCVPDIGVDVSDRATATATMLPVGTHTVVAGGNLYIPTEELTAIGGTFSEAAVFIVSTVETIVGQDETFFDVGEDEGSFVAGTGHAALDDITMSDGTIVRVDTVTTGAVTTFTITTKSATPHGTSGDTLTQSSTSGSGTGFSMTLGIANQAVAAVTSKIVSETTVGIYTVLPADPVASTSSGFGINATLNVDWGVKSVAVTDGGLGYTSAPAVTFDGLGSATATLTGDAVTAVTVTAPGSGYTATAIVTIASP